MLTSRCDNVRISVVCHPILLAAYSVLALVAHNISDILLSDAIRSLIVAIVAAVLLHVLLWLIVKDWTNAALISAVTIILFFSYGHVYRVVKTWIILGSSIGRHRFMIPVWGIILLFWIWWVSRKMRNSAHVTRFFNVAGVVLLVLPVLQIVAYQLDTYTSVTEFSTSINQVNAKFKSSSGEKLPDIYYIVLDGYARQDVLEDLYGYDNSEFTDFLKDNGFYIAENSRSNYNKTLLSLASSLNMEYVNYLSEILGVKSRNNELLSEMVKHSRVRNFVVEQGYQFVAFKSGFGKTTIQDADVYFSVSDERESFWSLNGFEEILLESTAARIIFDSPLSSAQFFQNLKVKGAYQAHRNRILYTLQQLSEIAEMEGDYFVFAHVIAPHPPFVFGAHGEEISPNYAFSLQDGSAFHGSPQAYIEGYRNQLTYINQLVRQAIKDILLRSDTSPVIIIQSDHGPGAYLVWNSLKETNIKERLTILNAYYFPDGYGGLLYPSITPVNSFRLVFNRLFDTKFDLLEDQSYFTDHIRPFEFNLVTELVDAN